MATQTLSQKKVAILVADGFEQAELTEPKQALDDAGAQTHIVSPNSDTVQGWNHYDKGDNFPCECDARQRKPRRL
jgi:protease I